MFSLQIIQKKFYVQTTTYLNKGGVPRQWFYIYFFGPTLTLYPNLPPPPSLFQNACIECLPAHLTVFPPAPLCCRPASAPWQPGGNACHHPSRRSNKLKKEYFGQKQCVSVCLTSKSLSACQAAHCALRRPNRVSLPCANSWTTLERGSRGVLEADRIEKFMSNVTYLRRAKNFIFDMSSAKLLLHGGSCGSVKHLLSNL